MLLDALGLLEDDAARVQAGKGFEEWTPEDGAFRLVRDFAGRTSIYLLCVCAGMGWC